MVSERVPSTGTWTVLVPGPPRIQTTTQAADRTIPAVASVWSTPMKDHQRLVGGSNDSRPTTARSTARSSPWRNSPGSSAAATTGLTAGVAERSDGASAARIASTAVVSAPRSRQRRR